MKGSVFQGPDIPGLPSSIPGSADALDGGLPGEQAAHCHQGNVTLDHVAADDGGVTGPQVVGNAEAFLDRRDVLHPRSLTDVEPAGP